MTKRLQLKPKPEACKIHKLTEYPLPLPRSLWRLYLKCLANDPRYTTQEMRDFAEKIEVKTEA